MAAAIGRRGGLGPWRGRVFLTVGRALYLGPAGDTTPHAHHALQVSVGLDAPIRLRSGEGRWREYAGALVPPDVTHQLDGGWDAVLLLYLEPESEDGRHWLPESRGGIRALHPRTVSALRASVRKLASTPSEMIGAENAYTDLLRSVGLRTDERAPSDPRVVEAVRRLRISPATHCSLRDLAHEVALSPSRFRHLFRRELGMSTQSYVVWLRIYNACVALARGASLTAAAVQAGFSDAPHFTRTFRRSFGLAPSQVAGRLTLTEDTAGPESRVGAEQPSR